MPTAMDAGVPARAALTITELSGAPDGYGLDDLPDRVLDQPELLRLAATVADSPELWAADVAFDSVHRHYVCLHRDQHVDVWLLCWTGGNDTGWHDHDVSSGAVAVVRGRLVEHALTIGDPGAGGTAIGAGHAYSFGPDHIHRLTGAADSTTDAISIHAYSPPLDRLGQYVIDGSGVLRRTCVAYTDELRALEGTE